LCGYKSFRDIIRRELINPKIIYLDCPFDVAAERDQKGLYKKAIAGEVKDFFGVDVIYQVPTKPDFKIKTDKVNSFNTVRNIRRFLSEWL
jgi:adenylylsulfate kinase-like enzyme